MGKILKLPFRIKITLEKTPKRKSYKNRYKVREQITNEVMYKKLENVMQEKKIFLDPNLKLSDLAALAGTNRTYISRALQAKELNFSGYVNGYRLKHMMSILEEENLSDEYRNGNELAEMIGFNCKRTMEKAIKKKHGVCLREMLERRCKE